MLLNLVQSQSFDARGGVHEKLKTRPFALVGTVIQLPKETVGIFWSQLVQNNTLETEIDIVRSQEIIFLIIIPSWSFFWYKGINELNVTSSFPMHLLTGHIQNKSLRVID